MAKKILLIDDDAGMHMVIVPILAQIGYVIISAKNGEQGFQLALNERPDLIILDVIMPGIKGRDLCIKIKSYDVLKNIPVIFLTAKDSQDDIQAELQAGAVTHISKPISPPDLINVVRSVIG
jgi:putative two-component system response regulator